MGDLPAIARRLVEDYLDDRGEGQQWGDAEDGLYADILVELEAAASGEPVATTELVRAVQQLVATNGEVARLRCSRGRLHKRVAELEEQLADRRTCGICGGPRCDCP